MSWQADIVTLFPDMFPGPLGMSLAGRALETGVWSCTAHDLRTHGRGRHRAVDDTPFGGGAGMVLRADVVASALDAVAASGRPVIYPTPRGKPFTQADARRYVAGSGVVVLCGRFEGVDERVLEQRGIEQVSMGDFVLSGGEIPALALLDACVRLLPGVMGSVLSDAEESFGEGLLEYPHYTKPALWDGLEVPAVLLSGHHGAIAAWRREQAELATRSRRPDLWAAYEARQATDKFRVH
ncbi:tRNA (guanine-N1)-methyltransferase [Neoasaia chiangmaiensis NBRC 101099]|uniref:tRNA (guanine-N(1)-)-methyltransferase n=1 Tax=Neoasaia chiangmaiensis TaxID=320497 RepID=A0A1U9KP94_9PROT|nr:tRNA (guanosine(37)-N1)-methyltransferase TrmD [Neoasaia chiangmaiensis]AQS87510.1 tRNA (guanine(37)-N(1))-methyltransferase [Neoasaia chiangmaiensis]GBR42445.1 tRNA (guanine-N1)-methyltransferase [Neoasaia chiangmaiensis NBRC 101099]GEN16308.1 tRNA (guanine-N(1)-)-methyltransferase [Neoasaia chiangmaiensis]